MSSLYRYLLYLSFPLFLLDFATKEMTVRSFLPPSEFGTETKPVIDGVFWLCRIHNTGVAFGKGNGGAYSNLIFGGISLAAMVAILVFWRKGVFPGKIGKLAAALVLSGIAGNLLDRIYRGYVVDFLLFDLKFMVWPAFNVADACICIAAALFFITSFQKEPAKADSTPA
jgi:signal peptidase II